MSLLNCEIYLQGRVTSIADAEIILLIAHLIQPPGSIPGVRRVSGNQTHKQNNWIYQSTVELQVPYYRNIPGK